LVTVSQADHALVERPASAPAATSQAVRPVSPGDIALSLCEDIASLEPEWRRFETKADCTVFQSFDWLSLWQHHIGAAAGIRPAIVLGRDAAGELLFLVPLAVEPGAIRRLTFLGEALCDYNAPLLVRGFAARLSAAETRDLWRAIRALLQSRPHLRHDVVALTKMPETIGDQANPLLHLDVALNPSGAHLTQLADSWDAFYTAKRSSATRRRDRTKRKRLGELGDVRFINPTDSHELRRTLETLIDQKTKSFARMGVQNLFARPGHREFFLDLATNPRTWSLVHVSRLDVGSSWAAINLGLTFGRTYYHVLASYDDGEVSRFGPGSAHLRDLLQRAIAHGFQYFEFTIGDERYKFEWSDTKVNLFDHVGTATLRGWPVVFAARAFRLMKRAIKQNPVLWYAFSAVRAALGSSRKGNSGGDDDAPPPAGHADSPSIAPR
jgi:CelD/BcsL family acetyltransferase involved in cellulose biosynthesis